PRSPSSRPPQRVQDHRLKRTTQVGLESSAPTGTRPPAQADDPGRPRVVRPNGYKTTGSSGRPRSASSRPPQRVQDHRLKRTTQVALESSAPTGTRPPAQADDPGRPRVVRPNGYKTTGSSGRPRSASSRPPQRVQDHRLKRTTQVALESSAPTGTRPPAQADDPGRPRVVRPNGYKTTGSSGRPRSASSRPPQRVQDHRLKRTTQVALESSAPTGTRPPAQADDPGRPRVVRPNGYKTTGSSGRPRSASSRPPQRVQDHRLKRTTQVALESSAPTGTRPPAQADDPGRPRVVRPNGYKTTGSSGRPRSASSRPPQRVQDHRLKRTTQVALESSAPTGTRPPAQADDPGRPRVVRPNGYKTTGSSGRPRSASSRPPQRVQDHRLKRTTQVALESSAPTGTRPPAQADDPGRPRVVRPNGYKTTGSSGRPRSPSSRPPQRVQDHRLKRTTQVAPESSAPTGTRPPAQADDP